MARISNNTVLREILTELKELRAILHRPLSNTKGEDLIAGSFGVKETTTEKCNKCGNTIVYNRGIVEVDTFYCLSCWKVKMTKEMIMEVKEKPKGLYGIPEIMKGVMNTQRNHVERTREAEKEKKPIVLLDEYEKKETKIPEQPNSFKDFAEGMKKVECVECKSKVSLAECNYDPARNRYTCHKCDKKLKEAERARKEAKTREQIKNLEGGIK